MVSKNSIFLFLTLKYLTVTVINIFIFFYKNFFRELSELTDILRDKGIRDSATSTTKTSTSKLDPTTYSLVVVRDRLRAALGRQSPPSSASSFSSATDVLSLERFRESESIQGK